MRSWFIWVNEIDGVPDVEYIDNALDGHEHSHCDFDAVRENGLMDWEYDPVPLLFEIGGYQFVGDKSPDIANNENNGLYVVTGMQQDLVDILLVAKTLVGTCATWEELFKNAAMILSS